MRHPSDFTVAALAALLLAACGGDAETQEAPRGTDDHVGLDLPSATAPPSADDGTARWELVPSGDGAALVFPAGGSPALRLSCMRSAGRIVVGVPAFRAIGSEERLSFGSGANVHALVVDMRGGDLQRSGVNGAGPVPGNLAALIGGPVAVSYGAQASGPHPAPPAALAGEFVRACRAGDAAPSPTASPPSAPTPPPTAGGACHTQDGKPVTAPPLRAVGTEPFWAATVDGRCVTYSHPEDQAGTRVWTKYSPRNAGGGTWTGALGGRPFVMHTRPQPGCSDGMSDRRYPIAVELIVGGERRQGCAAPR